MSVDANRILTGTSGKVWLNGKLISNIKKVELKITGSFEDVNLCGELATFSRYTGWSGEGSITLQKVDSTALSLLADAYQTGRMPDVKIITRITDTVTGQSERVAVSGVVFTECMLASFESKALLEEELPLKFTEYEVLEEIR